MEFGIKMVKVIEKLLLVLTVESILDSKEEWSAQIVEKNQ